MKRPTTLLIYVSVFMVLILACRCGRDSTRDDIVGPPSPDPTPTIKPVTGQVRRVTAGVMAGEVDPLAALDDDAWRDLLPRMRVGTDDTGEARLKVSGCMAVYLFQRSGMAYSLCSRSEDVSGNTTCHTGGSAIYNSSCGSQIQKVIQTPSANVKLMGTWISVTYLPDSQVTFTLVMKGSAEVTPVLDMEKRTYGEATVVKEGQYVMTAPDAKVQGDSDFAGDQRQAHDANNSPDTVRRYLGLWLDRIRAHAKEDGVSIDNAAISTDRPSEIDCDCEHVDAGFLTKQNRMQCIRAENGLHIRYAETGQITGTCDPVTSGPNAKPTGIVIQ